MTTHNQQTIEAFQVEIKLIKALKSIPEAYMLSEQRKARETRRNARKQA